MDKFETELVYQHLYFSIHKKWESDLDALKYRENDR